MPQSVTVLGPTGACVRMVLCDFPVRCTHCQGHGNDVRNGKDSGDTDLGRCDYYWVKMASVKTSGFASVMNEEVSHTFQRQ